MRMDSKRAAQRIVKEAVQQASRPGQSARVSGSGSAQGVRPEGSFTTPDGSGGDRHVFILGLDSLTDDTAFLPRAPVE